MKYKKLNLDNIIGFMFDQQKKFVLEQVVVGLSLVYRMNDWITLDVGAGERLYNNNDRFNGHLLWSSVE